MALALLHLGEKMASYDEIIPFDYTSEDEWQKWIKEKFLPLYKQFSIILKLREYLENLIKTNFKEAFSRQSIKEILLGGVTKDGEYSSSSLAKLYKDVLGVSINPKEWIVYCKAGLDPIENGIKCKFEDTSFLVFISKMRKLFEKIFHKVEIKPQEVEDKEIEEIVNSPEKILEVIGKIYKLVVSISANYDYHMFFILNTHFIPRFFIQKAYPKLKENFEKVIKILELEEKFVPNVSNERIKKDYTIFGHKENGFANILFSIQYTIWNYFNFSKDSFWDGEKWIELNELKEIFSSVVNPEDLKTNYKKNISRFFSKEINISRKIILISINKFDCKDCIREFEQQDRRHGYWYDREIYNIEFVLKNSLIEKVNHLLGYRRSWSGQRGTTSRVHDERLPLTIFFSNISLPLFLGIVSIVIKGNRILIENILR